MGLVDDCVQQKIEVSGNAPSDQDIAIKFSECEAELGMETSDTPSPDPDSDDSFVFTENDDINGQLAKSMHEKHFDEPLVSEEQAIEMIQKSKFFSKEGKDSVLGMAYNFYSKIFIDDDITKGNSFSNDVSQEMAKTVQEILNDMPHKTLTKEFIAFELARRGFDPRQAFEFVATRLSIEQEEPTGLTVAPNLTRINPIEQGMTVPNINARNGFVPNDTLFGGLDREEQDADVITEDPKPNLGTKAPAEDPNDESDQEEKEIGMKNSKRSATQDGFNEIPNRSDRPDNDNIGMERVHHIANSVLNSEQFKPEDLRQSDKMVSELGPCDPGSVLNPVTGTCEPVPDNPNTAIAGSRMDMTEESLKEPEWLTKVTEAFDCGCKNKTQEAYKILNS